MKPIFKLENQTTPNLSYNKKNHSYEEYSEIPKKSDSDFDFRILIHSILKRISENQLDEKYQKLIKIFKSIYNKLILKEILNPEYHFKFMRNESDMIFCIINKISINNLNEIYFQKLENSIILYLIEKNLIDINISNDKEKRYQFHLRFEDYIVRRREIIGKKNIDRKIERMRGEI